MTNRSEALTTMLTIDCPWCDGGLTLDAQSTLLDCNDCGVRVEFAPDPVAPPARVGDLLAA